MPRPEGRWIGAWVLAAVAAVAAGSTGTLAAFSGPASSNGNVVTAVNDFRAPAIGTPVITKSGGGTAGHIRSGGGYHVYADVSDSGNPASGVATVTANVGSITTGQSAAVLAAGSFSSGGISYNRRSALLTANGSLTPGAHAFSVTAADSAGNSRSVNGSVNADDVAPVAADVQASNGGATVGRAEAGDTLTLTFSEPVEPATILAGWTGSATAVVVRMTNQGLLGLGTDDVQIRNAASSAALPLGRVDLNRTDYVGGLLGGDIIEFGSTGTASSMALIGTALTVTLGTYNPIGLGSALTAGGNAIAQWAPVATPTDRAGNTMPSTAANESGAADKEF